MITDKMLDVSDRWLGAFVCAFFPGVLILDCIFGRGLFGTPPDNIYSFLLFAVYAAAISFVYVYLSQAEMECNFEEEFLKKTKSDRIGTMTAPVVAALAGLTIGLNELVELAGRFNPVEVSPWHAVVGNALVAFLLTLLLSKWSCGLYYRWYRHVFKLPAPSPSRP